MLANTYMYAHATSYVMYVYVHVTLHLKLKDSLVICPSLQLTMNNVSASHEN